MSCSLGHSPPCSTLKQRAGCWWCQCPSTTYLVNHIKSHIIADMNYPMIFLFINPDCIPSVLDILFVVHNYELFMYWVHHIACLWQVMAFWRSIYAEFCTHHHSCCRLWCSRPSRWILQKGKSHKGTTLSAVLNLHFPKSPAAKRSCLQSQQHGTHSELLETDITAIPDKPPYPRIICFILESCHRKDSPQTGHQLCTLSCKEVCYFTLSVHKTGDGHFCYHGRMRGNYPKAG